MAEGLPALAPADLLRDAPDAHCILAADGGAKARGSLWWCAGSLAGVRVGAIGHYAARDTSAGRCLLQHACEALARAGCGLAVGPMNGSTWRSYRFVTERGSEPCFFLEPDNPDDWPGHFREAGFAPLARYLSAVTALLAGQDRELTSRVGSFAERGIHLRPWQAADAEGELRRIYAVSRVSFRNNFLYTPIAESAFLDLYRPLLPFTDPRLIWLAEEGNRTVGFVFAIPDRLQARRGQAVDTVVVKSIAVLPGRAYAGLGRLLLGRVQETAYDLGCRRAIHALMHEANASRRLSARTAHPMRWYTLFARRLSP
jgi:GNAT superfamily N-acetyltransferase